MVTNNSSQSPARTYILVHGAAHGAWCWKKVIPLLEAKGNKVIAIDLPSSVNDTAKLAGIALEDDVKGVIDAANTVQEKVILLGHSSGGVVISQAAEILGPKKIDKLIYLDAFLPQNGESVFSQAEKIRANNKTSSVLTPNAPSAELLIFSEDNKSCKWNPGLVQELFYHDCSPEDVGFAKTHLSWQSVATLAAPVRVTEGCYGVIKKYYILCTQAKDLDKSSIVSNAYFEKIYTLPSSHSPFFSMPGKLVAVLIDIITDKIIQPTC